MITKKNKYFNICYIVKMLEINYLFNKYNFIEKYIFFSFSLYLNQKSKNSFTNIKVKILILISLLQLFFGFFFPAQ